VVFKEMKITNSSRVQKSLSLLDFDGVSSKNCIQEDWKTDKLTQTPAFHHNTIISHNRFNQMP